MKKQEAVSSFVFFPVAKVCLAHTLGRVHLERILDKTKLELEQSWKEIPVSLKTIKNVWPSSSPREAT